jgi:hypothetical protein
MEPRANGNNADLGGLSRMDLKDKLETLREEDLAST